MCIRDSLIPAKLISLLEEPATHDAIFFALIGPAVVSTPEHIPLFILIHVTSHF